MEQSAERRPIDVGSIAARTTEDVAHALQRLSDTDLMRLEAIARLRARGLPGGVTWSDLLNEAIRRALDGSRPWPSGVPLLAFLAQIMRSIWSEQCRRNARELRLMQSDAGCISGTDLNEMDPERIVAAATVLAGIYRLFAHDAAALNVIACLADGLTARETRDASGMSETDYDTTRRRIRRTLLRRGLRWREP